MAEHLENSERQLGRKRQQLAERLEEHPELKKRFEMILDIVDNAAGDVEKAEEAERQAIEAVRQLGKEVVQGWADRQHQKKQDECGKTPGMSRKEKKTPLVHRIRKNRDR
jgi:hypothetical protein